MGMAKISTVSSVVRRTGSGRLKRVALNTPVKIRKPLVSLRKKNKKLRLALALVLFVAFSFSFWRFYQLGQIDQGRVLGVAEEKEIFSEKYADENHYFYNQDIGLKIAAAGRVKNIPQNDGDYYEGVFLNTDLFFKKTAVGLKQQIIFQAPDHPAVLNYELSGIDTWQIDYKDKNIAFSGRSPGSSFQTECIISLPYIQDSADVRSFSALDIALENNILSLKIDKNWLTEAAYPLIIDLSLSCVEQ